jgi:hypothetical protein
MIAMSCLRLDRVRLVDDENTASEKRERPRPRKAGLRYSLTNI